MLKRMKNKPWQYQETKKMSITKTLPTQNLQPVEYVDLPEIERAMRDPERFAGIMLDKLPSMDYANYKAAFSYVDSLFASNEEHIAKQHGRNISSIEHLHKNIEAELLNEELKLERYAKELAEVSKQLLDELNGEEEYHE